MTLKAFTLNLLHKELLNKFDDRTRACKWTSKENEDVKGIVHFEINFWHVLAYLKGIHDVGVFVSAVVSTLIC